jgi:phage terminase large subunit-like protein
VKDFVGLGRRYAEQVVSREIPACKWVRLACERQLRDLERGEEYPYRFDEAAASRVCEFIELLPHTKGQWARRRETISLEPWQCFVLTVVFGWLHRETGLRRFREGYVEVPRKNAKSTLSSGIGLYLFAADGEPGAEVYSAATTRDQAKIVFDDARRMVQKTLDMQFHLGIEVVKNALVVEDSGSKFVPLAAEGSTLDGLNVHGAIVDELHAHKTRAVYDVIDSGRGSREQSLLWNITTAGSDRSGICYERRTHATKVLEGVFEDETTFAIIYTIDDGDDWADPAVWVKANPNYGVSVLPGYMEAQCRKALSMPSAVNNFLTKHLNVWVNADTAWMDMRAWDACAHPDMRPEDFAAQPCWVSLDLASKVDIAARVKLFDLGDGTYAVFGDYYLPERAVENSANSQYAGWVRRDLLHVTDGEVTDYDLIEQHVLEDCRDFDVVEVPYDPFQATQLSGHLLAENVPMVEMRPTVLNFSEPMKQLEALVLKKRLRHNGDPVLAWMVSNVVCHLDAKDNIYPRKERPENKIDGVVALIMALGRAMAPRESKEPEIVIL